MENMRIKLILGDIDYYGDDIVIGNIEDVLFFDTIEEACERGRFLIGQQLYNHYLIPNGETATIIYPDGYNS